MILPNIWKIIKFMFQTTNQPLCTHCITIYLDESPFLMDESPNSTQFWRPGVPTFGRALPFIVYLAASLFVRWRELDLVCFSQHDRCVLHIWPTNIRVFPFLFSTGTWFVYLIHTYWRCFLGECLSDMFLSGDRQFWDHLRCFLVQKQKQFQINAVFLSNIPLMGLNIWTTKTLIVSRENDLRPMENPPFLLLIFSIKTSI